MNPDWGFAIGMLIFLAILLTTRMSVYGHKWESKLRVIEEGHTPGRPVFRPATFWEKLKYMLGVEWKGPKWVRYDGGER
jgi:hypothetical protein